MCSTFLGTRSALTPAYFPRSAGAGFCKSHATVCAHMRCMRACKYALHWRPARILAAPARSSPMKGEVDATDTRVTPLWTSTAVNNLPERPPSACKRRDAPQSKESRITTERPEGHTRTPWGVKVVHACERWWPVRRVLGLLGARGGWQI